jgi:YD repeat-containing protein
MGRWTQTLYDALRRPVATRDAAGRLVQQQYCNCGSAVERLVDARANETSWGRDLQGRVTTEIRADGATYASAYETTTSRLTSVTDPKGNVKTHSYNPDDSLAGITYTVTAATAPTPNVTFTYDAAYNRVSTMADGTGTTTYAYYPSPVRRRSGRASSRASTDRSRTTRSSTPTTSWGG